MRLTKLQQNVASKAKRMMHKQPWYKGVCLDQFKEMKDKDIKDIGVYNAARNVVYDTMSWDAW